MNKLSKIIFFSLMVLLPILAHADNSAMTVGGGSGMTPGATYYQHTDGLLQSGATTYPFASIYPGFISRCRLGSTSTATTYLEPGSAVVNGTYLVWASSINWTGTSGNAPLNSAQQIVYVYLYSNSGTPTLEASATGIAWNATNNDYQKAGDATRRYVGYFLEFFDNSTTYRVCPFLQQYSGGDGRSIDEVYVFDTSLVSGVTYPFSALVGGSATTPTVQSITTQVPSYATHAYLLSKQIYSTTGVDGILFVGSRNFNSTATGGLPYYVRNAGTVIGGNRTFFGTTWIDIENDPAPYFYWGIYDFTGTMTADIECWGAKLYR